MVRKILLSAAFAVCCFGLAGQNHVRVEATGADSLRQEPDVERNLPDMYFGNFDDAFRNGYDIMPSLVRPELPYRAVPGRAVPEITAADLKIYNPYAGLDPAFYRSRNFVLMPVGMHYRNTVEGGDMAGVRGSFRLADNITASVGTFVSSAYSGYSHPDRVLNASLNLSLDVRVAERVTLRMFGQYSAAPGLNPALNPMIGGGNYFGGAVRVMITDKFGLEGGFTRSYFMGEWTNSYYVIPVIEGFGGIGISIGRDPFLFPATQHEMMRRRGIPVK